MGHDPEWIKFKVEDLHPAQMAVGMREVAVKQAEIEADCRSERHDFLKDHLVPILKGPGDRIFIVDHHHLVRALWQGGFHHAWCAVLADLSGLNPSAFWAEMHAKGWVYPFDAHNREQHYSAIPPHIKELQDDPYRSLAGFVRRKGGFTKADAQPFVDFRWANFFRERVEIGPGDAGFDKAVVAALRLAHSDAAKALPGFVKSS
jgi:hypothetical protein